jgi:hypothetical protein
MTTKRCSKCQLVKSLTEFSYKKGCRNGLNPTCRTCNSIKATKYNQIGLKILQTLAMSQGSCQHCSLPYSNEDWHFFEFDHIDAKLKVSKKETEASWVTAHQVEFLERIAQNLQLLCVKCHKIKTSEELKLGGLVYQKTFGDLPPPQVIETDLTLFDLSTLN